MQQVIARFCSKIIVNLTALSALAASVINLPDLLMLVMH